MASQPHTIERMTLQEFLARPGIDEQPYQEFLDGRVLHRVSPLLKRSCLMGRLTNRLQRFAEPEGLGMAFLSLRCSYANRSIVADIVYLSSSHIDYDERGDLIDETPIPPDIHIEIAQPDRPAESLCDRLLHSTTNGCPLGWRIDPERKTIDVFRPGLEPERLASNGDTLEGDPVLPGFRLPVADVFQWLKRRKGRRG